MQEITHSSYMKRIGMHGKGDLKMRTYGKKVKGCPRKLCHAEIVIEAFGGATKLANILGISVQNICNCKRRGGVIPAKYRQDIAFYIGQHPEIKLDGRHIWAKTNDDNTATVPTEGY